MSTRTFAKLLLLVVSFALAASAQAAGGLVPGDRAPAFTLNTLSGTSVSLAAELEAGPLVLAFFRTDCSACQKELPVLEQLSHEPALAGLRFLAVNVREPAETVSAFVAAQGFTFPVATDPDMIATRDYKVAVIPRLFFVKRDGVLQDVAGPLDVDALRAKLLALAARPPDEVLLVVPSRGRESGAAVIAAATAAGYVVHVWEMLTQGPVTEDELRKHMKHPVVRCIPEAKPEYAIGRDEETALLGFLSDGGRLLLTGNDIATSAGQTDVLRIYLQCELVAGDAGTLRVAGAATDSEFASFSTTLLSKTHEYGAVRPDVLLTGGTECSVFLEYQGEAGGSAGVAAVKVKT